MTRGLFWFRRDLRLTDNVGLRKARDGSGELLLLYVVDGSHKHWKHRNGDRLRFKLNAVKSLRQNLRELGGDLLVRTGNPTEVMTEICGKADVDSVFWNHGYEPYERRRDRGVTEGLNQNGINVSTFKDHVIHEKNEILTNDGNPYEVFSYYAQKWRSRPSPRPAKPVTNVEVPEDLEAGDVPSVQELGLETTLEHRNWIPEQPAAQHRWENFLDNGIHDYHVNRDYPARDGTSRMSPHIRFGLIGPRRLLQDCREAYSEHDESDGVKTFVKELIWRDFYHQVLYHHPSVTEGNFKSKFDSLDWEDHPEWLNAWKSGQTGIPIVDAAMRQLNRTGWMHNRLRMIVASFLTKDCLIHWKNGETYFMNRLLDGDTAANNGGWQWAASTGTDAAPYFRVFNPYSQSRSYDPAGRFIRRYCPELEKLDDEEIHEPHRLDDSRLEKAGVFLGKTYPEPILDHSKRREHALKTFERVDGN